MTRVKDFRVQWTNCNRRENKITCTMAHITKRDEKKCPQTSDSLIHPSFQLKTLPIFPWKVKNNQKEPPPSLSNLPIYLHATFLSNSSKLSLSSSKSKLLAYVPFLIATQVWGFFRTLAWCSLRLKWFSPQTVQGIFLSSSRPRSKVTLSVKPFLNTSYKQEPPPHNIITLLTRVETALFSSRVFFILCEYVCMYTLMYFFLWSFTPPIKIWISWG